MVKSTFITLPNELLDRIFADVDREDLKNLIKTHRSFIKSAQRHLFYTIKIPAQSTLAKPFIADPNRAVYTPPLHEYFRRNHDQNHGFKAAPPVLLPIPDAQMPQDYKREMAYEKVMARQRTCALFLQAITLKPHLVDYVRHVQLDSEWGAPLFVNTQACTILKKLPKLCRVEVVVKDWLAGPKWNKLQHVCKRQLCNMLRDSQIQTVVLKTPALKLLSKMIQIPTIQSFSIDTVVPWHRYRYSSTDIDLPNTYPDHWVNPTSLPNLTYFNSGSFIITPIATRKLLSEAKNLQSLLITIDSLYAFSNTIEVAANAPPFIPALDMLEEKLARASSLKELALLEPLNARFTIPPSPVYPTIHADFSFLKHLRILRITSAFWFNRDVDLLNAPEDGWMWQKQDRCSVRAYELLPPLLRELEIQFMWPEVVFAAGESFHAQFPLAPQTTQLEGFGWIKEFAEQKQSGESVLPELECLRLIEIREAVRSTDRPDSEIHPVDIYSPPEVMMELFEGAGIKLVIQLARALGT